jgi:hypothetical protein
MGNLVSWNNTETNISQQEFKEYQDKMNKIIYDLNNKIKHLNQNDSLIYEFDDEVQNFEIKQSTTQKINWLQENIDQLSSTINKLDTEDKTELKLKISQLNDIIYKLSTSVDSYLHIKSTIKHLEQKIKYIETFQIHTPNTHQNELYESVKNLELIDNENVEDGVNTNILSYIISTSSSAIYSGIKFPIKMIGNVILPEKDTTKIEEPEILIRNYNESSNLLYEAEFMDPLLVPIINSRDEKSNRNLLFGVKKLFKREKNDKGVFWTDKNIE